MIEKDLIGEGTSRLGISDRIITFFLFFPILFGKFLLGKKEKSDYSIVYRKLRFPRTTQQRKSEQSYRINRFSQVSTRTIPASINTYQYPPILIPINICQYIDMYRYHVKYFDITTLDLYGIHSTATWL